MDRRKLIRHIAVLTGAAVVGAEFFLSGCHSADHSVSGAFSADDILLFDDIAETILPQTDTPGAKSAEVGKFMANYSTDCYDPAQLKILRAGMDEINGSAENKYGNKFLRLDASQKQNLLTEIDAAAKKYNNEGEQSKKDQPPHYFTLMKQMVMLGFFTSKPGVTKVLRWIPVPGKHVGCIDYKEGETSWA